MNQNENVAQQDSNTSDMIFRCEEIVSWASRDATLLPGTVIMTGTAEGIGAARDPPVYMGPVSSTIPITFSPGKNCMYYFTPCVRDHGFYPPRGRAVDRN